MTVKGSAVCCCLVWDVWIKLWAPTWVPGCWQLNPRLQNKEKSLCTEGGEDFGTGVEAEVGGRQSRGLSGQARRGHVTLQLLMGSWTTLIQGAVLLPSPRFRKLVRVTPASCLDAQSTRMLSWIPASIVENVLQELRSSSNLGLTGGQAAHSACVSPLRAGSLFVLPEPGSDSPVTSNS